MNKSTKQPDNSLEEEKKEFEKIVNRSRKIIGSDNQKVYTVIAGSLRTPLIVGNIKIPAYVINTEIGAKAVLSGNGLQKAIGLPGKEGRELSSLLNKPGIKEIVPDSLKLLLSQRYLFKRPGAGGAIPQTYGYEAITLIQICKVFYDAGKKGLLDKDYQFIADKAEEYILAFAEKGVEQEVFRVTGYDELKSQLALVKLIGEHVSPIIQPYVPKFPSWFAEEIYRLKGWDYEPIKSGKIRNTNSQLGTITMDIVYDRLLPSLVEILKKLNNKRSKPGNLEHYHHQHLLDKGVDLLKNHFNLLEGLLKSSTAWSQFMINLDRIRPSQNNLQLALDFEEYTLQQSDTKLLNHS